VLSLPFSTELRYRCVPIASKGVFDKRIFKEQSFLLGSDVRQLPILSVFHAANTALMGRFVVLHAGCIMPLDQNTSSYLQRAKIEAENTENQRNDDCGDDAPNDPAGE
jgi:hypothetical protein